MSTFSLILVVKPKQKNPLFRRKDGFLELPILYLIVPFLHVLHPCFNGYTQNAHLCPIHHGGRQFIEGRQFIVYLYDAIKQKEQGYILVRLCRLKLRSQTEKKGRITLQECRAVL